MIQIGLIIFFGFIGLSLLLLLIINRIASKYINGDYIKVDEDEEKEDANDEVNVSDNNNEEVQTGTQQTTTAPYKEISPEEVFEGGSKTSLVVSLRYFQENEKIEGVVKSIDVHHLPKVLQSVKFKAWTTTKVKSQAVTASKKLDNGQNQEFVLALSFMLGPVSNVEILNASICIQMYGKQKGLKHHKSKCYGECYVNLNEIVGKLDAVEFTKTLMPVGVFLKDA